LRISRFFRDRKRLDVVEMLDASATDLSPVICVLPSWSNLNYRAHATGPTAKRAGFGCGDNAAAGGFGKREQAR
jgi:hypothetical protein